MDALDAEFEADLRAAEELAAEQSADESSDDDDADSETMIDEESISNCGTQVCCYC